MAEFAGAPIVCAFRERVSAKPGETIHITADPALVHLFDAGSGQRIDRLTRRLLTLRRRLYAAAQCGGIWRALGPDIPGREGPGRHDDRQLEDTTNDYSPGVIH